MAKILSYKLGMSLVFREDYVIPVTKLQIIKDKEDIDLSWLEEGKKVDVRGISKGKGFQGVVKRYGFHGAPASHGTKHAHREPGSIGATGPQRVWKGKKMPGRMGNKRVTVKNLEVVEFDKAKGLVLVKGAVPGAVKSKVEIISKE